MKIRLKLSDNFSLFLILIYILFFTLKRTWKCDPCENCATCQTNTTTCKTCSSPFFLVFGGTSCTTVCGNGFYGDTTKRTCEKCHVACAICDGPTSRNCTKCVETGNNYLDLPNTSCAPT